ncbi:hypothetical protein DFH09DRAFT_298375 [Mycena vulgaris]|nr:hypothetical protein DFH09DRAFT_298375 [Mycena vulgaris]
MPTARDGRRILRSNPSLSSLASSLSSLYTSTSSSTQWGPGALAGKAILALGKATLRGAERLVIFRRMVAIKARLPCLDDERSGADTCFMDGIFDDLVELSRPELYPESIRQPAMELILAQIASGHTTYLLNSLSKWLPDDLIVLIAEIISISMFCRDGFLEGRLSDAYIFALPEGCHPLGPCTSFLSELARQNQTTFEAVIMSKFLDMVLLSSRKHATEPGHFDKETQSSFSTAFAVLSTPSCQSYELWMVNLEQYWPFAYHPSLAEVVQHINKTSPGTWLLLEAHFLERKAHRMLELAMPCKYPMYSGRSVADVTYPRLKDFNLTSVVPPFQLQEILDSGLASSRALWHFLRCVALGGNVRSLMAEHLLSQSHRSRVSVFSRIIYLLIPNTCVIVYPTSRKSCLFFKAENQGQKK